MSIDRTHHQTRHCLTGEFLPRKVGFQRKCVTLTRGGLPPNRRRCEKPEAMREARWRFDGPGDARLYTDQPNA